MIYSHRATPIAKADDAGQTVLAVHLHSERSPTIALHVVANIKCLTLC